MNGTLFEFTMNNLSLVNFTLPPISINLFTQSVLRKSNSRRFFALKWTISASIESMITTSHNQSGSKKVNIVIISALAIALISAAGFAFWTNALQSNDNAEKSATTSLSPTPSTTPQASPNLEASDSVADKNTITLSDWKVQFTIPDSLKTGSVKYSQQMNHGMESYGFTTARIEALGGDCATQPYGKSLVLSRSANPLAGMYGYVAINNNPIDGYYYAYEETIPQCSGSATDPSVRVHQTEIDDKTLLRTLLGSLRAL